MTAPKRAKRRPRVVRGDSFVAQIVADSHVLGVERAAAKHRVSERTVERYRRRASTGEAPALTADVASKSAELEAAMQLETVELLRVIGKRIGELVAKPDADLYKVVGAYKVLSDRLSAAEITKQILGDPAAPAVPAVPPAGLRIVKPDPPNRSA